MNNLINDPLALFHPIIQKWFREKIGIPTDIQMQAWPYIASNRHVLLTAPTGSGKTLTAFLWALNRFAEGAWAQGRTRILYVSPLKALNNDIQRNLLSPLTAIREYFSDAGAAFPTLNVLVRSGDTPAHERRRMLCNPPDILITTPESLNLMLLTKAGRDSLSSLEVVILDEIHAVAGSKRGTHLITAVDRLVPLAGEFQRIALSATVKPLGTVAAWVAGYILGETGYIPRSMELIASRTPKSYELHVRYPVESVMTPANFGKIPDDRTGAAPVSGNNETDIWATIALEIKAVIAKSRSTLIFANNRRLAERLTRLINEGEDRPLAYAHHGSLSREIRNVVETRMKEGTLPAIVATNSLELGIDVGALDQVILVQTPFSIASALQKIGRAGHGVGQTSRAMLFASHGRDLLDAAAAVKCVLTGDLEPTRVVEGPLDILAQIIVSMAASEEWTCDRLFGFLRTSHPYRKLPRIHFDLILEMLAGRFAETRVRELRPRLSIDSITGIITPAKGMVMLVGLSGGTIPDRGLYTLRHADSRAKIGELDEEFVWERREGDMFTLGNQSWRIVRISSNEVEVQASDRNAQVAPFWRADERDRGFHLSQRLGEFLESADKRIADPSLHEELVEERGLEAPSADILIGYLGRQQAATGSALPHRHHLIIEEAGEAPGGGRQVIIHAVWGGRLNRPWAYAMAAAFEEKSGLKLEIISGDDALLIQLPEGEPAANLIDLVHEDNLEGLLRRRLEATGWFAAHFRENAARALLLPRSTPRARVPLWLNRLRSQNLLQSVSRFADFPVVLETWRECLRDEFDLPALKAMLVEVHSGIIRVTQVRTQSPSPFAESLLWKQTNKFMYEHDKPAKPMGAGELTSDPAGRDSGSVRPDLIREIAFSSPLRPKIPKAVIRDFESKAQRLVSGYAPQGAVELVEWVKERLLIPQAEWQKLLSRCPVPEEAQAKDEFLKYAGARLLAITLPGATTTLVVAVEVLPRVLGALGLTLQKVNCFAALLLEKNEVDHPARWLARESNPPLSETLENLHRMLLEFSNQSDAQPSQVILPALVSQWLRAYGPVTWEFLVPLFGETFAKLEETFPVLAESDSVIIDVLSADLDVTGATSRPMEICDAANVETLLRLMRRQSRPSFKTLPSAQLPLFLATWQGLTSPAQDLEGLQSSLEKLFGYPAPAAAWETDFLPARVMPYFPSRMDQLFQENDLLWIGQGKERIAFSFEEDLDLFNALPTVSDDALSVDQNRILEVLKFTTPTRLDFQAIASQCSLPSDRISELLWELAWMGRITNDTFLALRKGVETGFRTAMIPTQTEQKAPSRRSRFQRWKTTRPLAGKWRILETIDEGQPDALEREELAQDRVRQLLRRYGILFRELLGQESSALQWPALFRSLRLLELSGEVLAGHFFAGIPGLQFISPQALRQIEAGLPSNAVYWMSAQDPASPCALGLQGLPYALPPRLASTHLVFHGPDLVLVSRKLGRDLTIRVAPRHAYLAGYLGSLRQLTERAILPVKSIEVETVNGEPVLGSPYLEDLLDAGFERGMKTVSLRKRF